MGAYGGLGRSTQGMMSPMSGYGASRKIKPLVTNVKYCVLYSYYTAKTEGLKQPRLGHFSCSHKFTNEFRAQIAITNE